MGDKKNGFHREKAKGLNYEEGYYIDGKKNGLWEFYFRGYLYESREMKDDKFHGESIVYYEDGTINSYRTFDMSFLRGLNYKYDKRGKLEFKCYWDDFGLCGLNILGRKKDGKPYLLEFYI